MTIDTPAKLTCARRQNENRLSQGRKTRGNAMREITRRAIIQKSLGLAAAGTLLRPYISRAAATTAEVWWPQGFIPEEDTTIKKIVADYEKTSGNKIELVITPFAPQRQKIVAA